jgi:glycosyltransferase involved in cell wall biosynthesis
MTSSDQQWPQDIFVLIPSYQSVLTLEKLLGKLLKNVPAGNICVFDDASDDGTDELCEKIGVRYKAHTENTGKGASLSDGFSYILGNYNARWIITMDADGQHSPDDIRFFLEYVQLHPDTGICIGTRSKKLTDMPFLRIISNTLTSSILSLLCATHIYDSQCGYRIYSSDLLKQIHCEYKRFEMESEIIIKAVHKSFSVGHVKVQTLYLNGDSHISHIKDTVRWIRSVIKIWIMTRKNK